MKVQPYHVCMSFTPSTLKYIPIMQNLFSQIERYHVSLTTPFCCEAAAFSLSNTSTVTVLLPRSPWKTTPCRLP